MNLFATIELYGGGPGSGCNPEVAQPRCGRPAEGSVGFVSPNEQEGLTFEQALSKLGSPEQASVLRRGKELLKSGTVESAIGDWSDGAENSSILKTDNADKQKMDYTVAKLGMEYNQKAVISFTRNDTGKDTVWELQASGELQDIRKTLDGLGIQYRTLVPGQNGTRVYLFDQNTELGDKVVQAASKLGSDLEFTRGTGEFIGGDTREEGRRAYEKVIGNYEKGRSLRSQGQRIEDRRSGLRWGSPQA